MSVVSDAFDPQAIADQYLSPPSKDTSRSDVSDLLDRMHGGEFDQESSGNYQVRRNPRTGAVGGFQVLPENVPAWTSKHYGKRLTPSEFENNPQAQEAVFNGEMGDYLRKAREVAPDDDTAIRMGAAAWYGGIGRMHRYDDPVRFRANEPSFREYTQGVLNKSGKGFDANSVADQYLTAAFDADSIAAQYLDNRGGQPVTPTVATPQTVKSLQTPQDVAEQPVTPVYAPEPPATIQAQAEAATRADNNRAGVLLAPGETPKIDDPQWAGFGAFPTPDGRVMMVNLDAAKKLKLKDPSHIQSYLDKNPKAIATLLDKQVDVGTDTGNDQPVVTTTLMKGGVPVEATSTVVTKPSDIPKEAEAQQKQFPQGQIRLASTDRVVEQRAKHYVADSGTISDATYDEQGNLIPQATPPSNDPARQANTQQVDAKNALGAVSDILTPPKDLTEAQASDYIRKQLSAKYGDGKFDKFQFLTGYHPGTPVHVTYGDLQAAGIDINPVIGQKVVENRVENPKPDLRVGGDFTKNFADDLKNTFGERAGTGLAAFIATGGKTAQQIGGLVRLVEMLNPATNAEKAIDPNTPDGYATDVYKYLQGVGNDTQQLLSNTGVKEVTYDENGRPIVSDDAASTVTKKGVEIAGDLMRLYAMAGALPGASSVAGRMAEGATLFGTQNAVETAGAGAEPSEIARQTAKGVATGGLFGIAGAVGDVGTDLVGTLVNKAIPKVFTEGLTLGTIAGGTYGIDKIAGDTDAAALQEAIVNSAFHLAPRLLGKTAEFVDDLGRRVKARISNRGEVSVAPDDIPATVEVSIPKHGPAEIVTKNVLEPAADATADDLRKKVAPPIIPSPVAAAPKTNDGQVPISENAPKVEQAKLAEKLSQENAIKDQAPITDNTETNGTAPVTTEKPAVETNAVAPEIKTVTHPNPAIDGKEIIAETQDGKVIVPNSENKSGVSVVKDRSSEPVREQGATGDAAQGEPEKQKVSSTKNSTVEKERMDRGLQPIEKEAKRDFGTVWNSAVKTAEENPDAGANLVRDLLADPKKVPTDEENALLLHRKIQLRNKFDVVANDLVKATEADNSTDVAAARIRLAPVQDALDEIDRVTTAAGTAAGRGLNARRMMANEDFSLAALELRTRAANGGRQLSDEEFSNLKKVADDYKQKTDLLEQHLADRNITIAKMEANWPNSRVIATAENLVKKLDLRADAARKRLEKRGAVFTAGLDPLVLKDLAEIGASHIATAGLDFAKWTEKMLSEFGDKVRPHLEQLWKASNDVFDGLGARDKVIGNRPTDEVKLKAWKTRANNRLAELGKKIDESDFTRKKREPFTKFDAEAIRLKADVERVVRTFNKGIKAKELAQRPGNEKAQDLFTKYRRAAVLSGPSTLGKLTAAAIGRTITEPMERIVEHAWGKVLPGLAKQMSREFGFRTIAEAKAITEMFTSGLKDAQANLKNQDSDLETVFGKPRLQDSSVLDYFGSIHAALKAPIKRGVFARNLELGFAKVIKEGGNPLDPAIQSQVGLRAFHEAERAIFMHDNALTDAYKSALNRLERKGKNGKTPVPTKVLSTVLRTLLPIVKIPTNFVGETVQYAAGLPAGFWKLKNAYRDGIDSLPPDDADQIMRWLTKGSLGAGALALGATIPAAFGGYYAGKRDDKDVKAGNVRVFGVEVPSLLLHTPLLETMQIGANFRRVMDSRLKKSDEETQGPAMAALASSIGLIEEVPFIKETANLSKLLDAKTRMDFVYDVGKNIVVPQISSQTAAYLDKPDSAGWKKYVPLLIDPIKRKPTGFGQTVEMGIPGLRNNVPEAAPDKSRVSDDAQELQLKHGKITAEMDKIEQLDAKGGDSAKIRESLQEKLDNKFDRGSLTQAEAERANKILGLSGEDAYEGQVDEAPPKLSGKYNKDADGLLERIAGWAKAIGTDPLDAFDKLTKLETFKRMENGTIIVERMSKDESSAERKRLGGGAKAVKLDHFIPLELGGTNAQDNLKLVTTEEWERYTPMENYLAGALHDGKITGSQAKDLIRNFKLGWIGEKDVAERVGEPFSGEIPDTSVTKPKQALKMPSLRH